MPDTLKAPATSPAAGPQAVAQLAKQALRRLALAKLEPTPENYARAYAMEAGTAAPPAAQTAPSVPATTGAAAEPAPAPAASLPPIALATLQRLTVGTSSDPVERQALQSLLQSARWDEAQVLLERLQAAEGPAAQGELLAGTLDLLVRSLERGGRQWTVARKKDSLGRLLAANRNDGPRLARRLRQLVASWDDDGLTGVELGSDATGTTPDAPQGAGAGGPAAPSTVSAPSAPPAETPAPANLAAPPWPALAQHLHQTVQVALQAAPDDANAARAAGLAQELQSALQASTDTATPDAAQRKAQVQHFGELNEQAQRLLAHRRHLQAQLGGLCVELSSSLVDLSEDESWAQGQASVVQDALAQGLSALNVRGVSERLQQTRERQRSLRQERNTAQQALKTLLNTLLGELSALSDHTDRFNSSLGRYADHVQAADSLASLTELVREMVEESHSVHHLVQGTQSRLQAEHSRAQELAGEVQRLEGELRRLADEVHTDQLTQVANRRGLLASFAQEQARLAREERPLSLALLDLDNFKKLNDSLGHAAGDEALKNLAARAQSIVRPGDLVARYGGEEFVLLLPNTPLDEAQQVLGRLQRALSASLFLHDGRDVFVTFSAGATLYRAGESLEAALERADEALYEAKRSGKNRTCTA